MVEELLASWYLTFHMSRLMAAPRVLDRRLWVLIKKTTKFSLIAYSKTKTRLGARSRRIPRKSSHSWTCVATKSI